MTVVNHLVGYPTFGGEGAGSDANVCHFGILTWEAMRERVPRGF
jgi:hypothetical protein